MKSVVARFTEVKKNVSDIEGDIEDMDINKVDAALKSVGISLKDQAGQIRDLDDVFLELSAIWNDLDRNSQRYIATIAAGSRQQSRFIALMENYERTIQLIEIAQDSAGRSSEQFAKYADSVANKVNRLKNTWEQFRINLVDEKTYKWVLDNLNNLLQKFTKVNLSQAGVFVVWGMTIGKKLIQGIIEGLRSGGNAISTGIEAALLKLNTGKTKIEIQTNLREITDNQIPLVKQKLEELRTIQSSSAQAIGSIPVSGFTNLEAALNSINYSLDITKDKFQLLNLAEMSSTDITQLLMDKLGMTKIQAELTAQAIEREKQSHINATNAVQQQETALTQLVTKQKELQNDLAKSQNWGKIGNAIGSAMGTMATMAFMGTFDAEQIGKTISIQLVTSGISTLMSAISAAIAGGGAAFLAAGGPAGLAIAAIGGLLAFIVPKIVEWRKEQKYLNDEVYKSQVDYKKATEEAKKFAEILDEQKKKFDEISQKGKDVENIRNTFENLSQKVVLTDEEQQDLNEATKELSELMPELIDHYDAQGNAVIEINDNYKEQIKLLKETIALEERKTALANLNAVQGSINKQEAGYYQATRELNRAAIVELNTGTFDEYGERIDSTYSLLENFDEFMSKWTEVSSEIFNAADMDKSTEQAFIQAYNDALGTAITSLEDIPKLWSIVENKEKYKREIIENLKHSLIDAVKETSELDEEYFNTYFDYESKKIEQQKELSQALSTLYSSMFKEELLKYDDSERKEVMTSIFNNMLLNDEDVLNKYLEKRKEVGERNLTENELRELVDTKEMKEIADEVNSLSPELYESLTFFYDNLSALTSAELDELIQKFSQYTYIYENLQKLVNQTNTSKYNKISEYAEKYSQFKYGKNQFGVQEKILPSYLQSLYDSNSATIVNSVLSKAETIADKQGANAGRRYIEAFNKAVGDKSETVKNFLANQDWSTIDPIHEESQIKGIAAQMVDAGLSDTIDSAKELINNFITNATKEVLGIHTSLESIGDIQAVKETATKGFNLFQENADAFTVLFAAKADQKSIELTQAEFKKLWDTIDKLNKDKESPYNIDLRKYFNTEDGKFVIENISDFINELKEPMKGLNELEQLLDELDKKIANSTGSEQEGFMAMRNEVQETVVLLRSAKAYVEDFEKTARKSITTFRDIEKSISSIASDYQSIVSEQEDKGFLSSKSLEGFLSNIETLNEQLDKTSLSNKKLDVNSILTRNEKGFQVSTAALRNYIIALIQATYATEGLSEEDEHLQQRLQAILDDLNAFEAERLKKAQEEALEAAKEKEEELQKAADDAKKAMEDAQKAAEDAEKDAEEAKEKIKEAEEALAEAQKKVNEKYEDIEEKQKKVIELQEELNELLYGTGDSRKSTLDGLYNYEQRLSAINSTLEDVKSSLEDINNVNLRGSVYEYGAMMHSRKATLMSQQSVYSNNLSAIKTEISPYTAYFTEVNGRLLADVAKINAAQMNDKYKDWLESQISAYNDSVDKIHEIKKEIESVEKEFADFQKTYRDKYISLQETVIETLKEQAQEELNVTKEKYAAMEEADNDYVAALEEAINKQRELRQLEQETNELSEKEKKLSLLRRDTSGARQKDVLKQQKDIEKSRQSLLDKNVDNIIKNLKELYKQQKEARDAEIQYQEQVLQNATYIEEANAIIQSWGTADEMIGWFIEHNQKTQEMTAEQLEKYSEELAEMYNAREIYMTTSMKDFSEMLNVQQDEINQITTETAEHLTSEAHRSFEEVKKEVDEAIEKAREDLDEALDAVQQAKNELVELLNDIEVKIQAVTDAQLKSAEAAGLAAQANRDLAASKAALAEAESKYEQAKNEREQVENNSQTMNKDIGGSGTYKTVSNKSNSTPIKKMTIPSYSDAQGAADEYAERQREIEKANQIKNNTNNNLKNDEVIKTGISYYKGVTGDTANDTNKIYEGLSYESKKDLEKELSIYYVGYKNGKKVGPSFSSFGELEEWVKKQTIGTITRNSWYHNISGKTYKYVAYKKGGMVDYTGPAWVDGTPAQPEAFLSAEDTRNIAHFTDVLSSLYNSFGQFNPSISSTHETTINVTVNVDGVSSDYDVDQAVERVKQSIIDAANQTGSTVILHQ